MKIWATFILFCVTGWIVAINVVEGWFPVWISYILGASTLVWLMCSDSRVQLYTDTINRDIDRAAGRICSSHKGRERVKKILGFSIMLMILPWLLMAVGGNNE
jgi:hypothetical protein